METSGHGKQALPAIFGRQECRVTVYHVSLVENSESVELCDAE